MTTEQIDSIIAEVKLASQRPNAYAFLPEILESLERMRSAIKSSREQRIRMAGAMGRLVTENYDFSESSLGTKLLSLADEFALY